MNGNVFSGHVVRTTTVPAFKDASTGVQKSEIVHSEKSFIALNVDTAKAIILANAITVSKVDVNDPAAQIEVKIASY